MNETSKFTDAELAFGDECPALGPDYKRASDVAERAMSAFEVEHFNPLLDEFQKQFVDKMWDTMTDHLLSDTEMNLQSEMRRIAESSVFALLHGHKGYCHRYVLGDNFQAEKVREAIFEQFKDDIILKGIQERDEEIKRLKETINLRY